MRLLVLCLLAAAAAAQGPSSQDLKANLEKKLAGPFVKNAAWVTDFGEVKRQAKELKKPIFAYFTRSYAP